MLLTKGIEVELFAGKENGEVLPLSGKLIEQFPDFSQEPDERNFEYITKPTRDYSILFNEIHEPRIRIRNYLKKEGLTIIPGSTMPLPFEKKSFPSKPNDPYSKFILDTYKTSIVTTSLHMNIGIDNMESFFKLLCALRLDTCLFLALSASSPFHDGKVTGFNSYRWHSFPHTPTFVPFFTNHDKYISWSDEQLSTKKMFNPRHLWASIRPNGPNRPHDINRIEIRICDFMYDTKKVVAIVAFIETLIQHYLSTENWPQILNKTEKELDDLANLTTKQEELVAKDGLDATIWDWRNDTFSKTSSIIESILKDIEPTAEKLGITKYLAPVTNILKYGNEATNYLKKYNIEGSIPKTMQYFIQEFNIMDIEYGSLIQPLNK